MHLRALASQRPRLLGLAAARHLPRRATIVRASFSTAPARQAEEADGLTSGRRHMLKAAREEALSAQVTRRCSHYRLSSTATHRGSLRKSERSGA